MSLADEIGNHWKNGEKLVASGCFHDALLNFQKAKAILISESYAMFIKSEENSSKKTTALMGATMEKITASINKSIDILTKNPVLALGLKKGFTAEDVKKQYRSLALKYHPG